MKDARLEFTCTEWGLILPAHDSPVLVRPQTRADADRLILVLDVMKGHLASVRAKLPDTTDVTSEHPSVNQIVGLTGAVLRSEPGSMR